MRRQNVCVWTGIIAMLAAPAFGQGRGQGRGGGVVGGVTGTVGGAVALPAPAAGHAKGGGNAGGPEAGVGVSSTLNASQNSVLYTRLEPLLPPGMPPATAATGFENQGRFLSAVHAAHNLNIPFEQLKAEMTGSHDASLGAAIRKLKPSLSSQEVKDNVKLAGRQAERDLQQARSAGKPDKVAVSIAADPRLAARLSAMLPEGMTLADAAAGFKNQGQFVATLEVSRNLGIPFVELKDRVTAGQSLGAAIRALRPSLTESEANASAEAAESQSAKIRSGN